LIPFDRQYSDIPFDSIQIFQLLNASVIASKTIALYRNVKRDILLWRCSS